MSSTNHKVTILLATLNGAKFLQEQLQSYRTQTYPNWELLVSDDGSVDETVEIIRDFANSVPQRVTVVQGMRFGHWQNFMSMVRRSDIDGEFFAYSDQDDIWLDQKLEKALAWLMTISQDVPAVYFTRTMLIADNGKFLGLSPLFTRAPSFQNALVQNIGGGNTMIFNRAAQRVLAATPANAVLVSHDWWTYQVVTGVGGLAYFDPWPSLKYRQHGQNLIGSNAGLRARAARLQAFLGRRFVQWSEININALNSMRNLLNPASVATLDRFTGSRSASGLKKIHLLWKSNVYRQSILETVVLFAGSLLNRI
jgi:glycosyltransferase involved in cell wall biosynthesis